MPALLTNLLAGSFAPAVLTRTTAQGPPSSGSVMFNGGLAADVELLYDGLVVDRPSFAAPVPDGPGEWTVSWNGTVWGLYGNGILVYSAIGDTAHPSDAEWQGGTITLESISLAGAAVGQLCRVGDSTPYEWYRWDGTSWESIDIPEQAVLTASKVVTNQAARLALSLANAEGFVVIDEDTGKSWMMIPDGDPSDADDWKQVGDRDIQWADVGGKPTIPTVDNASVNTAIAEDPAASRYAMNARFVKTPSAGCVLGDSTVAVYPALSLESVASYLLTTADSQAGSTVTSLAVAGHTIAQQKSAWVADTNKATYDWILVEIGLNDIQPEVSTATTLAAYQDLIDTINAGKKSGAVVIAAAMTPCKARLISLYGAIDGATSHAKWQAMNVAIMGGSSGITGVDYRIDSHVAILDRGDGNLATCYQVATPDDVHENAEGRKAIAAEWAKVLNSAGFLTKATPANHDRNFSQESTYTLVKGNRLGINTRSPILELDIQATPTQTGAVAGRVRQGNSGSVNYAFFDVAGNSAIGRTLTTSSTWSSNSIQFQNGVTFTGDGAGGLSIGGTHASGDLRFYAGGTVSSGKFKAATKVFHLVPMAEPAGAAGDIYYDSSTNKLRCHNGSAWQDCF